MVEELLAARGIVVSYGDVRHWALKFGQEIANRIRRRLPLAGDTWHLDEVAVKIAVCVSAQVFDSDQHRKCMS
jgi:putative transposase